MFGGKGKRGDFIRTLAIIFASLVVLLVSIRLRLGQEHIGVAILLGAIAFIIVFRLEVRNRLPEISWEALRLSKPAMRLLEIGFFIVILITSLIVLVQSQRPLEYFFILPVAAGLLGVQIVGGGGENVKRVLAQCVLLALALWAGLVFNYATLWGSDVFFHYEFAQYIAEVGYVPDVSEYHALQYNDSPLYHVLIVSHVLVLDVGSILTVFLSTTLPIALALPLVYVVTKYITKSRYVSMLAMLIYGISDMLMLYSVTLITPGSMTLVLILAVLAIAFSNNSGKRGIFLIIVMMGAALLAHQLTIAVAAVVFAGLFLIDLRLDIPRWIRSLRKLPEPESETEIKDAKWRAMNPWAYVFMGVGVMVVWLLSDSRFEGDSFLMIMLRKILESFLNIVMENPFHTHSLGGSLSNALYQLGYIALLTLAVLGMLHLLRLRGDEKKIISLVAVAVLLVLIIYGAPLTPLNDLLLTYRWMTFLYVFLAMGAAWALALLPRIPITEWGKRIIVPAACLLLTFLMVTTPFVSADNPLFEADRVTRSAFNADEVTPMGMMGVIQGGPMVSDPVFSGRILYYYYAGGPIGTYQVGDDFSLSSESLCSPLYHVRTALSEDAFLSTDNQEFGWKRPVILGPGFVHSLHADANLSIVYSSGGSVILR